MKVFIPNDITLNVPDKGLFILTRPFRSQSVWRNDPTVLENWGLDTTEIRYTEVAANADVILLPYSINAYLEAGKKANLIEYNKLAKELSINGYAFVSGDWGRKFQEFERITYFRMGGFRKQLSARNQGFPVSLSDHHKRLYGDDQIQIREKQRVPTMGFCGHASLSISKLFKESLKFLIENGKRGLNNSTHKNWEPIFPSAYYRAKILFTLEHDPKVTTNFIYRKHYRAGAISEKQLDDTTREYYDNIRNSDYLLCVRGGGNFSVRLYETLMMGRIPVFVNTDCLLPFPDQINWKNHVVWVEWKDRHHIGDAIKNFHDQLTDSDFKELQWRNRKLWQEELSVRGMLNNIQSQQY